MATEREIEAADKAYEAVRDATAPCPRCVGTGWIRNGEDCPRCHGAAEILANDHLAAMRAALEAAERERCQATKTEGDRMNIYEECANISENLYGEGPSTPYDNGATSDGWNMACRKIAEEIRCRDKLLGAPPTPRQSRRYNR